MKITKVYPNSRRTWDNPRCMSNVNEETARFRKRLGRSVKCSFRASYNVDGEILCERHAGKKVLRILAEEPSTISRPEEIQNA